MINYLSIRTEILRRNLQRDGEPLQASHLLGEEVGLPDEAVGPGDVLAQLRQAPFEGVVPGKKIGTHENTLFGRSEL